MNCAQRGKTSLILAIENKHEAAAEVLVAATVSAGALDVQVDVRGREGFDGWCMWLADEVEVGGVGVGRGGAGGEGGGRGMVGREGGAEEREGRRAVLTHAGVPEQDQSYNRSALMWASAKGMTNLVKKLVAAGAKAELTDEVKGRRGWWAGHVWWERGRCVRGGTGWEEDGIWWCGEVR